MKNILLPSLIVSSMLLGGCETKTEGGNTSKAEIENAAHTAADKKNSDEIIRLNKDYFARPDEKILDNNGASSPVYGELKKRYKQQMGALKKSVEATGAKFVVVMITPEVGPSSNLTRYGHPFIKATCNELGIEVYDFTPSIAVQSPKVITQVPRDGHWSKKGAVFLASLLSPIIKKYAGHKSTVTYKDAERPETFGDLQPDDDEILDGGKDLPYHLKANSQGLRMDHNVKFPKTKQHILFMGGSQIYSPFLDNEFITTTLLGKQFPDAEIMNSAMLSGCTDDFLSLWEEKAKYSEPDVVIVQTNGTDITDLFFTNRNYLARSHKPYYPSDIEEKYFRETYLK